jgi:DNA invertase Pin-like site-specific DNA recombinase
LDAQRATVLNYLDGGNWKLVSEHTETESGKRDDNRPALAEAFKACRVRKATLVIARIDRLSRDAHFLLGLEKAGVEFVAVDMPQMSRAMLGMRAVFAEEERRLISERTKHPLQAAKARGVKLGGRRAGAGVPDDARQRGRKAQQSAARQRASDLASDIANLQATGAATLQALANGLNARGIPAARGGAWSPVQVKRVIDRLEQIA